MFPAQQAVPQINSDGFPRCEERRQMMMDRNHLSPTKKTDSEIKESIYRVLWEDDVLRALEYHQIDVHVENGTVYLSGHIISATSLRRVEDAIQDIPFIVGIKNNLVLDDNLTLQIAASLEKLEHTYHCKFFVGASHGVISLNGTVNDKNVKLLAEQCAASNLSVRGVINHVRISGDKPVLQDHLFLQPTIGAIIYFMDGIFGVVKHVIINPHNRCVIQVIIEGQFSAQRQNLRSLTNNPAEILQKTIVIPVSLIRYLTDSSGFLTVLSTETTRYKDFNPLYFTAPNMDWAPPYPYCRDDVLFMVNTEETGTQIIIGSNLEHRQMIKIAESVS